MSPSLLSSFTNIWISPAVAESISSPQSSPLSWAALSFVCRLRNRCHLCGNPGVGIVCPLEIESCFCSGLSGVFDKQVNAEPAVNCYSNSLVGRKKWQILQHLVFFWYGAWRVCRISGWGWLLGFLPFLPSWKTSLLHFIFATYIYCCFFLVRSTLVNTTFVFISACVRATLQFIA